MTMEPSKGRLRHYEGMFLVGQNQASDLQNVVDHITGIITKHGGKIVSMQKWDERRLAYEIDKNKRGIYILTYFEIDPTQMHEIDRECNLSETILRSMCLNASHLTLEEMQSADARAELETEAKLRAEQADEAPASA
ncbi:MAG: 30S ribosomal protein S6 [Planctomycetota bacterium]